MSSINLFGDAAFGISGTITADVQNATNTVSLSNTTLQDYVNDTSNALTFTGTDIEFSFITRSNPLLGVGGGLVSQVEAVVGAYKSALTYIWEHYDASGEFVTAPGSDISNALDALMTTMTTLYNGSTILRDNFSQNPSPSAYVSTGDIGSQSWDKANVVVSKEITFEFNGLEKLLGLESGISGVTTSLVQANYPNIVAAIKDTSSRGEAGTGLSGVDDFDSFAAYTNAIPVTIQVTNNVIQTVTLTLDYTGITYNQTGAVDVGTFNVNNNAPSLVSGANTSYTLTSSATRLINYNTGAVSVLTDAASNDYTAQVKADFTITDSDSDPSGKIEDISNVTFKFDASLTFDQQENAVGTLPHFTTATGDATDDTTQQKSITVQVGLLSTVRNTLILADCLYKAPVA